MKFLHIQNVSTPKISTWQTFLHRQCPWGPRQISSKVTSIGSKKKPSKLDEIYVQYGFDGKSGKPAKLFFWQLWKCCSANFTANIYFAMPCIPSWLQCNAMHAMHTKLSGCTKNNHLYCTRESVYSMCSCNPVWIMERGPSWPKLFANWGTAMQSTPNSKETWPCQSHH